MHRLFGEVQVSEEAHERRQNPARFRPVESLNGPADLFGHWRRHLRQTNKRSGSAQLRSGFHCPQFNNSTMRKKVFYDFLMKRSGLSKEIFAKVEKRLGSFLSQVTVNRKGFFLAFETWA